MFKDLIISINEAGLTSTIYYSFHVLGVLLALINYLYDAKHLNIKFWKALVTFLIVYPVIYVLRYGIRWFERLFYDCEGANIIKAFIFLPVVIWPVARFLKINRHKVYQLFAVVPCIGQGISHLGCITSGCCRGYTASWGVYNIIFHTLCVPVQLFEAISAILIAIYFEKRFRKNKWQTDPQSMPLMFVLFGSSRFVLEFLRDNTKIILNISNPAFHCLLMVIVGFVWLWNIKANKQGLGLVNKN